MTERKYKLPDKCGLGEGTHFACECVLHCLEETTIRAEAAENAVVDLTRRLDELVRQLKKIK